MPAREVKTGSKSGDGGSGESLREGGEGTDTVVPPQVHLLCVPLVHLACLCVCILEPGLMLLLSYCNWTPFWIGLS